MTDDSSKPKPSLHPVFTVTNIQNKVRVLDGTKVTYASWVRLFKLHARGYKVMSHIDGTTPPAKTDESYESWSEVDAHVLQWIYGTLSDDLLPRVLNDDSTARDAWLRVEQIFNNNKGARAAALEREFNNLKLDKMPSLEAYCQRLRDISGMLRDVDAPVSDRRLVIQLVQGLPGEYSTVASYINQTSPDFETARSMLELEKHRQCATDEPATALAAPAAPVTSESWTDNHPRPPTSGPRPHNNNNNNNRYYNRRNNTPRGSYNNSHRQQQVQPSHAPPTPPWTPPAAWTPPPCPYPTYPGWVQPWPAPPARPPYARASTGPRSHGHAYIMEPEAPQPTDLTQSFQALSVQHQLEPWYMDTGASSHLTSDQGYSDWEHDLAE